MLNNMLRLGMFVSIFMINACGEETGRFYNDPDVSTDVNDIELQAFNASKVSISGTVVDAAGMPLEGVELSIGNESVHSNVAGAFTFDNLDKSNVRLKVEHDSYYEENIILTLQQQTDTNSVMIPPIILSQQVAGQTRMLFGGDVSFGRRFLDPQETTPVNEVPASYSDALIRVGDVESGTRDVLQWIRPLYQSVDWGVLNLETPVTNQPMTPHPEKAFIFFTLPESLPALSWLGVDYVSLGNNHVYDYREQGVIDTLRNLEQAGLAYSGAGSNIDTAMQSYRATLGGVNYSFFSATSANGHQHALSYVAEEAKGGAADLTNDQAVSDALQYEANQGQTIIAQLHSGQEYTFKPTNYVLGRMRLVVDNGADLVVTHHPHVAQGVGIRDGVPIIHGLGNLAFDQDRQETLLGLLARVDMKAESVSQIRLMPVYLEDYRPRLIGGELASLFLRRISEFSHDYGLFVFPYLGQAWVVNSRDEVQQLSRSIHLDITLPPSGEAIIDLRQLLEGDESLASIEGAAGVTFKLGRDLMLFGDFEDYDSDETQMESTRWNLAGQSKYICLENTLRGSSALCSERSYAHQSDSVVKYRNRIRVMGDALNLPQKELTLYGYARGDNAGSVEIKVEYLASVGEQSFGSEVLSWDGGDYEWREFSKHLAMPEDFATEAEDINLGEVNARALKFSIRHSPPISAKGVAVFDDIAVISWESMPEALPLETPHARDFILVKGDPGATTPLDMRVIQYSPTI